MNFKSLILGSFSGYYRLLVIGTIFAQEDLVPSYYPMIRNYITTLTRNFFRQKEYSILNLLGLSLGMATCLIILLYVIHEFSFDRHHSKANRVFRIIQNQINNNKPLAWVGGGMAPMVRQEFPEFEKVASISNTFAIVSKSSTIDPISFREENVFFAEPEILDILDIEVLEGANANILDQPGQILLTEKTAVKYFKNESAIGQTLLVGKTNAVVTGVIRDFPSSSHLHPDMLVSMATFKSEYGFSAADNFSSYWWPFTWTYVLLKEGESHHTINDRFSSVIKKHRQEPEASNFIPALQPLTDIHFSDYISEVEANGNRSLVYIFISIAAFLLLLACVNFMNLATARAIKRSKEVGVRKVIGANRFQLIFQFMHEALWASALAMVLALVFAELALPYFNQQLSLTLSIPYNQAYLWVSMCIIMIVAGLLAGSYPAFYLSSFKPVSVLKGRISSRVGATDLRKVLVVFQFAVSITLIICSTVAYWQIDYLRNANLGFDSQHIITIDQLGANSTYSTLQDQLEQSSAVVLTAGTNARPGMDSGWGPFSFETTGITADDKLTIRQQLVSYDFFELLNLKIVAGRTFDKASGADEGRMYLMRDRFPAYDGRNYIINESAATLIGKTPEEALGQPMRIYTEENGELFSDFKGTIVGVVKDYHSSSLRDKIEPTAYLLGNANYYGGILVKLSEGEFTTTLANIEDIWKKVNPAIPFKYSFLNEEINRQYQSEEKLGVIIGSFSLMVLFVACLGLFGLSAYTAESKTKEIGIRKALGASTSGIVRMLSYDFIGLVAISLAIAIPAGWYISRTWLQEFAYQMNLSVWYFILAGSGCLLIAWLTISWQSIKAAMANPIDSLRTE
jgi:putative ABC transport system permease protein